MSVKIDIDLYSINTECLYWDICNDCEKYSSYCSLPELVYNIYNIENVIPKVYRCEIQGEFCYKLNFEGSASARDVLVDIPWRYLAVARGKYFKRESSIELISDVVTDSKSNSIIVWPAGFTYFSEDGRHLIFADSYLSPSTMGNLLPKIREAFVSHMDSLGFEYDASRDIKIIRKENYYEVLLICRDGDTANRVLSTFRERYATKSWLGRSAVGILTEFVGGDVGARFIFALDSGLFPV